MRILVVEDEKRLNRIICEELADEGISTDSCFDGEAALEYAALAEYDVIVLDIMMPKLDGFQVLGILRERGIKTPVLFLTARDGVDDKVRGLESGADYYLTKPFSFEELMAVIHVMTRKTAGNTTSVYKVADLELDEGAHTVFRGGEEIRLSAKEFSLLEYMMRNKGVVLTREMIENNLWNFDYEGGTNVVDVYIGYLRKKLDKDREKKLIHTVWGTGWVLKE
ncbi:MAG: response regulator transcription factor [Lachnospiraceae bacterium]|nr:response regulator transcription factor [Lachnospiraceae bacterium]